jgi:hypothetical protein
MQCHGRTGFGPCAAWSQQQLSELVHRPIVHRRSHHPDQEIQNSQCIASTATILSCQFRNLTTKKEAG